MRLTIWPRAAPVESIVVHISRAEIRRLLDGLGGIYHRPKSVPSLILILEEDVPPPDADQSVDERNEGTTDAI